MTFVRGSSASLQEADGSRMAPHSYSG
jgi:hypothetical protein